MTRRKDRLPPAGMAHCFHTRTIKLEGQDAIMIEACCFCCIKQTVIGHAKRLLGHGQTPQVVWNRPGVFEGAICPKRPTK